MTAPLNRLSAQITLAWDGTTIRAEMPGKNGARQKIEEATFNDLPMWIKNRLITEIEAQKDIMRAATQQTQNDNIRRVIQSPGMGRDFAKKIWHDGELAFNRQWKKHLAGEAGNLASARHARAEASPQARERQAPTVDNQTLDKLKLTRKDLKEGLDL